MELVQNLGRPNLWRQPVYARFLEEVDPLNDRDRFRPLSSAYDGNVTLWGFPSPEPNLPDQFWQQVHTHLVHPTIQVAGARLAGAVAQWEPDPDQLLFVAILRAGVPIADWLCRLLPGSVAVSISLFSGLGIDHVAFAKIRSDYPGRKVVFVDGWTGRGGVARELARLNVGPLAVLIDPWGIATFSGSFDDVLCPTACFTGLTTLGFSRTFYTDDQTCFSAYLLPSNYTRQDLITAWQNACPIDRLDPLPRPSMMNKSTPLRVHGNEVCRALINANPEIIYFLGSEIHALEHYALVLALAELRNVKVVYYSQQLEHYQTQVACSFKLK